MDDADSLVHAFACHLVAVQAENASPKTVRLYDGRHKQFLTFLLQQGEKPPFSLDLLNAANVRRASIWIREHSKGSRGGESAARALVGTLKTTSAWLADDGYIELDLVARVKRPRVSASARTPFSQAEVRELVAAALDTRMATRDIAIIHLLLDTGMRVGGLCSILIEDVNVRDHRLELRLKGGRRHALYFGSSDRRDGGRTVRALKQYLTERDTILQRWRDRGVAPRDSGHLFIAQDGWPLNEGGARSIMARLASISGVKHVFPHRFRHAQPLHSPVLTPSGWQALGALHTGDNVIGVDGRSTSVVGVYPQGPQEVVRVQFSDSATAECTLDHLWTVRRSQSKVWPREHPAQFQTLSTREIIASGGKWHTPVVSPVEFSPRDPLPMDAYTLGALLGDGYFGTQLVLATAKEEREVIDRIEAALPNGHFVSGAPGRYVLGIGRARRTPNELLTAAKSLGLIGVKAPKKAIPAAYLTASIDVRQELLRGLMDTDGYVNKKGCAEFTTISPDLAAGVMELVRSLGGIATVKTRQPYKLATHVAYRVGVRTPFTPFHMTSKRERYEDVLRKMPFLRTIKSIKPIGVADCVCIEVANPDGLYVTQDYVVTHNTFATWYLVRHTGDETGLRGILGHLSDDMYRVYAHLAHEIIAQRAGRVALSEAWLGDEQAG